MVSKVKDSRILMKLKWYYLSSYLNPTFILKSCLSSLVLVVIVRSWYGIARSLHVIAILLVIARSLYVIARFLCYYLYNLHVIISLYMLLPVFYISYCQVSTCYYHCLYMLLPVLYICYASVSTCYCQVSICYYQVSLCYFQVSICYCQSSIYVTAGPLNAISRSL